MLLPLFLSYSYRPMSIQWLKTSFWHSFGHWLYLMFPMYDEILASAGGNVTESYSLHYPKIWILFTAIIVAIALERNVIFTKFSTLAAPEVVKVAIFCVASDENFVKMIFIFVSLSTRHVTKTHLIILEQPIVIPNFKYLTEVIKQWLCQHDNGAIHSHLASLAFARNRKGKKSLIQTLK